MMDDQFYNGACFGLHAERLLVDTRTISKGGKVVQQAQQRCLEELMPVLLFYLPKLAKCSFDGPLYQSTLSHLAQRPTLKELDLRGSDWYIGRGGSYSNRSHGWVWRDWMELSLDFRVLVSLTGLQRLKVGRVTPWEMPHLATGITSLPLKEFNLSFCPWVESMDPRHTLTLHELFMSSLACVFREFCLRRPGPERCRRLPSTLQKVILRDFYHEYGPKWFNDPIWDQVSVDISHAFQDCGE